MCFGFGDRGAEEQGERGDGNRQGTGRGIGMAVDLWFLGPCMDWVASAVIDHGLAVQWAADAEQVRKDAPLAAGGIAVLEDERALALGMRDLRRLAPAWMTLRNAPGWGGERWQRTSEGLCALGQVRLVRPPRAPWAARAQRHNVHTREALAEILAGMGLVGTAEPGGLLPPARVRR